MKASTLLVITLTLALAIAGWSQSMSTGGSTPAPAGTQPIAPGQNGVVSTSGPLNTSSGYVYNGAPASPPILVAPIVHLGPVLQDVGPSQVGSTAPVGATGASNSNGSAEVLAQDNQVVNRGVASFESVYDSGSDTSLTSGQSLAELAARNRGRNSAQSAHVYTNADVQQMNQQTGVTGGVTGAAAGASTGTAPATAPSTAPSVARPAGAQPQDPNGVTSPFSPRAQQQPPVPHEQSQIGAAGTTQMAEANPPAVPGAAPEAQSSANPAGAPSSAGETAQPQTGEAAQQSGSKLPRTASPLPLLALAGLAAGGVGMILRRR